MGITQNRQIELPEDLKNLKPPTRQDAIDTLRRRFSLGTRHIDRFEDTTLGEQCGRGMYGEEKCQEYRRAFEEKYEAGIADGMAQATREYEEKLARKARIEEQNAAALEAEVSALKARFLQYPGASEAEFEKALPGLLEERRKQQALTGQSERERMMDAMRANISI